jgi:hypothetical protein
VKAHLDEPLDSPNNGTAISGITNKIKNAFNCAQSAIGQTMAQNLSALGQDLKTSVQIGLPSGPAVCGVVVMSEPGLAPVYIPCSAAVSAGTTATLAVGSVGKWNIRNVASTLGSVGFCAANEF